MWVASGLEPRHVRRCLPRHGLHGMNANMGSPNHASVWDVGYFPPCAVAATCGIGVRPRAASRVPMPVPCTARRTIQAVPGLRHESRRGRPGPRVEQLLRRLHGRTLESRSPASQPIGNYLLFQNVPGRARMSQPRRTPPPAARQDTPAAPPQESAKGNGMRTTVSAGRVPFAGRSAIGLDSNHATARPQA